MENWKTVSGTGGMIEVSDKGRMRSLLRGEPHILKSQEDRKGYERVTVTVDRKKMTIKVHRAVAEAFIRNKCHLPQVNHIDGNKRNNTVGNLEWVTNKQNAHHAIESGLWDSVMRGARLENERRKKTVVATGPDGESVRFGSVSDAERFFCSRHISDALKGKRAHVKGYSFRYEEVTRP